MRLDPRFYTLALTLLGFASEAQSQAPVPTGTGMGLGISAMTESRHGESLGFNPALLGLTDQPESSFSLPAIEGMIQGGVRSPGPGLSRALHGGGIKEYSRWGQTLDREEVKGGFSWGAHWFSSYITGFGITVFSRDVSRVNLTGDDLAVLSGRAPADEEGAKGTAHSHRTTTLIAGRSFSIGNLPLLGPTWTGASAKGTLVHHFSEGHAYRGTQSDVRWRLPGEAPGATIQDPLLPGFHLPLRRTEGGTVFGADLGLTSIPLDNVLLSATLTNVYQTARVGADALSVRHFHSLGEKVLTEFGEEVRTSILSEEDHQAWDAFVSHVAFPRLARVALAVDLQRVRVGVGLVAPYQETPSIDQTGTERWGVSVSSLTEPGRSAAFTKMRDGSTVLEFAAHLDSCGSRTSGGIRLRRGDGYGFGIALSHALAPLRVCH